MVSPTEITWRMEEAFAPYLSFLAETFIVPKHILEKEADPNTAAFNQAPVGTGAFKWGERVAGDHIELVANPDYFGEGPYLEQLIFKYIPDITVLYTQFKSGDIDLVGQAYITADHYEEASKLPDRVVTLVPQAIGRVDLPQPRAAAVQGPGGPPGALRGYRQASDHRRALLRRADDRPRPSCRSSPSTTTRTCRRRSSTSTRRARSSTRPAGCPDADGIRAKNGVRLSFANSTTSGNHLREQAQQFLQQTFAEIGVEMTISNLPAAVMWGDFWVQVAVRHGDRRHHLLIGGRPGRHQPLAHRARSPRKGGTRLEHTPIFQPGGRRAARGRALAPSIRKSAREIYHRVQETRPSRPALPAAVCQYTAVDGHKEGLEGFMPNVNTRTESWNAAGWYWAS